jgi:hypothetical protein
VFVAERCAADIRRIPHLHHLRFLAELHLNFDSMPKPKESTTQSETLRGWQQISDFLGEPVSVVQRWAGDGMPVRHEGRFVVTSPAELNAWLGKEAGKPVHAATETTDLTAELKRGLSYVRHGTEASAERSRK